MNDDEEERRDPPPPPPQYLEGAGPAGTDPGTEPADEFDPGPQDGPDLVTPDDHGDPGHLGTEVP